MIIKVNKECRKAFTVIEQDVTRNLKLSAKALGILVKLLSLPEEWQFNLEGIFSLFPEDGRDTIRTGIDELRKAGHIFTKKLKGDKGATTWYICELATNEPKSEKSNMDNPDMEKPDMVNHMQSNNDNNKNINDINKINEYDSDFDLRTAELFINNDIFELIDEKIIIECVENHVMFLVDKFRDVLVQKKNKGETINNQTKYFEKMLENISTKDFASQQLQWYKKRSEKKNKE